MIPSANLFTKHCASESPSITTYTGLSNDEVSRDILHKLQLAGASTSIIDPAALAATHSFTQGNPRLIDNLMTDALAIGSQQERKVIDAETIRATVENQGLY